MQIWRCGGRNVFDIETVDFEVEHLTNREIQCLRQLAVGERPQKIAAILGIAPITVEFHIRNARRKLGAKTREHAIAIVISRLRTHSAPRNND